MAIPTLDTQSASLEAIRIPENARDFDRDHVDAHRAIENIARKHRMDQALSHRIQHRAHPRCERGTAVD